MKVSDASAARVRPEFAWGTRTFVMAIVNVTPDSFSGDGTGGELESAVTLAREASEAGADVIDVGGESTRPGHDPISVAEEIERVVPAIRAIAGATSLPISVDTSRAAVAEAAIAAGASIVNDVRGLTRDPELAAVVARHGLAVVIMHDVPPDPATDLVDSIARELTGRIDLAVAAGVDVARIIVDPGFGFGKDWRQNLELLRRLSELKALDLPLLVGFSRKSTIGRVLDLPVEERLEGTLATTALAIAGGADIVRVHDVRVNVRAARMTDAVVRPRLYASEGRSG
jgi:dihydropteroate synthase